MWKAVASNALTLFIVVLALAAAIVAWGRNEFVKPGPLADAVCVQVDRGASLSAVSRKLEEQGAVSNGRIFRIAANYSDKSSGLKFGSYLVSPHSSMEEILDLLTRGGASTCGQEIQLVIGVSAPSVVLRELDPATGRFIEIAKFAPDEEPPEAYRTAIERGDIRFSVTLVEGATSWAVNNALSKADFLSGEVGEQAAEGWLAPQSYEVEKGADRKSLVEWMRLTQERILAEAWPNRQDDLPYASPEEAMVMASIIEKETSVAEERRLVASVFVNRLRQGMRLQTDPTVIYGVTKGVGVLGRGLRQSELRGNTPYNTYVIDGLPPTPIANPGKASIEAALNPDASEFIFFVADGTGGHAFAKTLDEHNKNVANWRKIEALEAEKAKAAQ